MPQGVCGDGASSKSMEVNGNDTNVGIARDCNITLCLISLMTNEVLDIIIGLFLDD